MNTTTETTTTEISSAPGWTWILWLGVVFVIVVGWMFFARDKNDNSTARNNPPPATPTVVVKVIPSVIYGETPSTLKDLNHAFNLEADEPTWVKFPNQEPISVSPGFNRCMPPRKYSGDVMITAQSSPTARVAYRIYRVAQGENTCTP
jgi:hypothetical protein